MTARALSALSTTRDGVLIVSQLASDLALKLHLSTHFLKPLLVLSIKVVFLRKHIVRQSLVCRIFTKE